MAFGLFKKQDFCDKIYQNGHVFTQDTQLPWAEAVAVKDGKVFAVGDSNGMEGITGPNTEIIDLKGRFLFPGFIDIHRNPVMKAFSDKFVSLDVADDINTIVSKVEEFIDTHDVDVVFGYGFDDRLLNDAQGEESEEKSCTVNLSPLDEIETEAPIVLLSCSTFSCLTNKIAKNIIYETAEEEMIDVVTVDYVLNLLVPFGADEINELVDEYTMKLSERGVTTFLSQKAPAFLEGLFQEGIMARYNEGVLRNRMFASYFMTLPIETRALLWRLEQRRTTVLELGGLIHADGLDISINNEPSLLPFNENNLNAILEAVCDRKYNITLNAETHDDLLLAYKCLDSLRAKGYKTDITIASSSELTTEEQKNLIDWQDVYKSWELQDLSDTLLSDKVSSPEEAVDELTIYAAEMLGMRESLGSIEKGKFADFAVFSENPLELSMSKFAKLEADMTVLSGEIVYSAEETVNDDLMNMMMGTQF